MQYLLVLLVTAVVVVKGQDTYGTEYDNLDVEAIVADKEQFMSFIDCFTDATPCNELAASFKRALPEAIVEACAKCTPAQKHIVKVFNEAFRKNMPQEFEKFKDRFDPERKYYPNFETAVAAF